MIIRIFTEECPQPAVVRYIVKHLTNEDITNVEFACNHNGNIEVFPSLPNHQISIQLFQGTTSSVDYLVYKDEDSEPTLLIEATKTTDTHSRNTSAYQRLIKFIIAKRYYPNTALIMFFEGDFKSKLTPTLKFGIRLLKTMNIDIIGIDGKQMFKHISPFVNVDDLIEEKMQMKLNKRNVSVVIRKKHEMAYEIQAKLEKSGTFGHDPNKGLVSALCYCIDMFHNGCVIDICSHGLTQSMVSKGSNKFMYAIKDMNVRFHNLTLPTSINMPPDYIKLVSYESEKFASLSCHFTFMSDGWDCLFHNHAGSARSYFLKEDGKQIQVPKKFTIPDIVFKKNNNIHFIESKNRNTLMKGDQQLATLESFETFVRNIYPKCVIQKGLCVSLPKGVKAPATNHTIMHIFKY